MIDYILFWLAKGVAVFLGGLFFLLACVLVVVASHFYCKWKK